MRNVSIDYSKKLMRIREAENLDRREFSDITGIPLNTIQKYETGHQPARSLLVEQVIQIARFKKYALWLMTDQTAEIAGQIAPPLSLDGSETPTDAQESIRTIQKSHR